jgi:hypothetical protein
VFVYFLRKLFQIYLIINRTQSHPCFVLVESVLPIVLFLFFCCCHIMCLLFSVPCCDVLYDSRNNNDFLFVFISSCFKKGACLIYVISVCLLIVVSNTYCVFVCLFVIIFYIVCPILPVSLDCPSFIAPSALSTDPAVNYFPESGTYISILCDYFIFNIWYQQSYDLIIWSPTKTINFFKCLYLIIC